ncbi:MAG: NAD-dependent epimerase/dehydratase family protein [Planctomycetota bacterium]
MNILVTGGAGFIGSHLVDALIAAKHKVTVLDCLDPQVHGKNPKKPGYLNPKARFVRGFVEDQSLVKRLLKGTDVLFHEAAAVGVGQSMYEIERYTRQNTQSAAALLQAVVDSKVKLKKMIVASSMSIYGEGLYKCSRHGMIASNLRSKAQLKKRQWEMRCLHCDRELTARPTPESKPLAPESIYAINKRDHEEMFLVSGRAYGIDAVALRYFNVYGQRQALSNPYTGAAAIFSSAILNERKPIIFEDGEQSRDFTHVSDIVAANMLVLRHPRARDAIYNVGTGRSTSINRLVALLSKTLGWNGGADIQSAFRAGDIRHCYADISKLKALGFKPRVRLEDGIRDLCSWVARQRADSLSAEAKSLLVKRGLVL